MMRRKIEGERGRGVCAEAELRWDLRKRWGIHMIGYRIPIVVVGDGFYGVCRDEDQLSAGMGVAKLDPIWLSAAPTARSRR
jgi:hypothetical protein